MESKFLAFQSLENKIQKSLEIISDTLKKFGNEDVAVAWTGGKDSTCLLHLIRLHYNGNIPLKIFNIDTSVKFKEIYEFISILRKQWNLNVISLKHPDAENIVKTAKNREECCKLLKIDILKQAIKDYKIKALFTGIRWDEHPARANEKFFSEQDDHVRINPILHFTRKDIWNYIINNNIPYCSLYDEGYTSLGCEPCTSKNKDSDNERGGRSFDKEKIMDRLRQLGYF